MSNNSNGTSILVQGRIVWAIGKLFDGAQKKDNKGNIVLDQSGQPVVEYGFGLAIPKVGPDGQNHPEYVKAYQALHGEGMTIYPQGLPPAFALKYKDGDTDVDKNGKRYSDRTGYAGHIVISCTTRIPIKFFKWDGQNNVQVVDGIKCGDYVEAQLNIKAHPPLHGGDPGLYVNPNAVRLLAEGAEIVNAPSGDDIFGNQQNTYQGQIEAPTMGAMPTVNQGQMGMPQQPQQGQMGMPQQPMQQPQQPMQQPQQPQVQPHHGVLPNNMQPQQGQTGMPQQPQQPMQQQGQMGMPQQPQQPQQPMQQQGQMPMPQPNVMGNQ